MKKKVITCDTLIIGGGQAGLISANILSNLGYETILVEKSPILGGGNSSFQNSFGDTFDYGYHALDYNRSLFTSNFFKSLLDNEINVFNLKRGLLLNNKIIKYAEVPNKWPKDFKITTKKVKDDIDVNIPITKKKLTKIYGKKFTEFIYKKVLYSYPSLIKLKSLGHSEKDLIQQVYPWFFPKILKTKKAKTEFQLYHDKVRNEGNQKIMYPKKGGFSQFMEAIVKNSNPKYLNIFKNAQNMKFHFKDEHVKTVAFNDKIIKAKNIYWCTSLTYLAEMMNINVKKSDATKQEIILGSFTFKDKIQTNYHEILVGDPNCNFNRIGFPKKLSNDTVINTLQVEYYFPKGEFLETSEEWKKIWTKQLKKAGIVEEENKLLEFDFKRYDAGYLNSDSNTKHIKELQKKLNSKSSNIFVPFRGEGPENINRIVPTVFKNVIDKITTQQ